MSIGHLAATGVDYTDPQDALLEADEYMVNHRVTEAWRIIARLHATLTRLLDGQEAHEERVRAEERERIARNIQAAADAAWTGTPRNAYLDAVRIAREGA